MNRIEMFKFRHIFAGDDHIGKYNAQAHTVTLRDEFANMADEVKAFFMRNHGICLSTVIIGTESLETFKAVREFPPEILELKSAQFGDLTPAVLDWARKNFTKEEFDRRYRGCPEYDPYEMPAPSPVEVDEETEAEPVNEAAPPKPRRAKPQTSNLKKS